MIDENKILHFSSREQNVKKIIQKAKSVLKESFVSFILKRSWNDMKWVNIVKVKLLHIGEVTIYNGTKSWGILTLLKMT